MPWRRRARRPRGIRARDRSTRPEASPKEIRPDEVDLAVAEESVTLANDYVLVFAGVEVKTFRGEVYAPAN